MPNLFSITITLAVTVFTPILEVSKMAYEYSNSELMDIVLGEARQNAVVVSRFPVDICKLATESWKRLRF